MPIVVENHFDEMLSLCEFIDDFYWQNQTIDNVGLYDEYQFGFCSINMQFLSRFLHCLKFISRNSFTKYIDQYWSYWIANLDITKLCAPTEFEPMADFSHSTIITDWPREPIDIYQTN